MSEEEVKKEKYYPLEKFGDLLFKIQDVSTLKAGVKMFDDLLLINQLKQEVEKLESGIFAGKCAIFAMSVSKMSDEQYGLAGSSTKGRLDFLKKKLGIVDLTPEQIMEAIDSLKARHEEMDKILSAAQIECLKNPTTENANNLLAVQKEAAENLKKIEEEFEKLKEEPNFNITKPDNSKQG